MSKGREVRPDYQPEKQVILRLPPQLAEKLRNAMRTQGTQEVEFSMQDQRRGTFKFGNETKPLTLVDLPAIIESHRTFNSATYYKSGDISQMLVVHNPEETGTELPPGVDDNFSSRHGITPPMRNYKRKFARKRKPVPVPVMRDTESELVRVMRKNQVIGATIGADLGTEKIELLDESALADAEADVGGPTTPLTPSGQQQRDADEMSEISVADDTSSTPAPRPPAAPAPAPLPAPKQRKRKPAAAAAPPPTPAPATAPAPAAATALPSLKLRISLPVPSPAASSALAMPASPLPSPAILSGGDSMPDDGLADMPDVFGSPTPTPPPARSAAPPALQLSAPAPAPLPVQLSVTAAAPSPPVPAASPAPPPTPLSFSVPATPAPQTPSLAISDARFQELQESEKKLQADVAVLQTRAAEVRAQLASTSNPIIRSRYEKMMAELSTQLSNTTRSLEMVQMELVAKRT